MRCHFIFILPLTLSLLFISGCKKPEPRVGLNVTYPAELTKMPDGSFAESNQAGMKRVRVMIDPGEDLLLPNNEGIKIIFRFRQTEERIANALPEPGSKTGFYFDLPYSEYLKLCEKIQYRWKIDYEDSRTSTRATFTSEPRFVTQLEIKKEDGSTVQGQCGK